MIQRTRSHTAGEGEGVGLRNEEQKAQRNYFQGAHNLNKANPGSRSMFRQPGRLFIITFETVKQVLTQAIR